MPQEKIIQKNLPSSCSIGDSAYAAASNPLDHVSIDLGDLRQRAVENSTFSI